MITNGDAGLCIRMCSRESLTSADPDVAAVRTRTQIALFGVASDGRLEKKVAGGTLVSVAAFPPFGREEAREIFFIQESSRAQLAELARLADEGHLRPQAGAVYPLAQAAGVYSAKAAGGIPGRIVLQP